MNTQMWPWYTTDYILHECPFKFKINAKLHCKTSRPWSTLLDPSHASLIPNIKIQLYHSTWISLGCLLCSLMYTLLSRNTNVKYHNPHKPTHITPFYKVFAEFYYLISHINPQWMSCYFPSLWFYHIHNPQICFDI